MKHNLERDSLPVWLGERPNAALQNHSIRMLISISLPPVTPLTSSAPSRSINLMTDLVTILASCCRTLTNYPPKCFLAARDLVSLSTVRVRSMLSIWFLAFLLFEDVVATK